MNMMNDTLIRNTFRNLSKPILLNPETDNQYTVQGFITNATLSPNSSYHLHSVNEFKRGDITKLTDNDYYIVTGDVICERVSKYKATMDYCNYQNIITERVRDKIIGTNSNGMPIYSYIDKVVGLFVGVMRQREVLVSSSTGVSVANTETILTLADSQKAREFYTINKQFTFAGATWKVMNINTLKTGLLELKLSTVNV